MSKNRYTTRHIPFTFVDVSESSRLEDKTRAIVMDYKGFIDICIWDKELGEWIDPKSEFFTDVFENPIAFSVIGQDINNPIRT